MSFFAVSNFSSVIRIQISTEIKQKTLQELNCSIITAISKSFYQLFFHGLATGIKGQKKYSHPDNLIRRSSTSNKGVSSFQKLVIGL